MREEQANAFAMNKLTVGVSDTELAGIRDAGRVPPTGAAGKEGTFVVHLIQKNLFDIDLIFVLFVCHLVVIPSRKIAFKILCVGLKCICGYCLLLF